MSNEYHLLISAYNWTGLFSSAYPENSLVPDAEGKYNLIYSILNTQQDALDFGYQSGSIWVDGIRSVNAQQASSISKVTSSGIAWGAEASDIASISFTLDSPSNSHIAFGSQSLNSFSSSNEGGLAIVYPSAQGENGSVWLNDGFNLVSSSGYTDEVIEWDNNPSVSDHTVRHELLHVLGMDDFHETSLLNSPLDSQKYSVLSYKLIEGMDPTGPGNEVYPTGLQLFDIAALQAIYGANWIKRNGATTYDKDGAFASNSLNDAFIYTIWDGGGEDTIDVSGYLTSAKIDLRQGGFSSVGLRADGSSAFEMTVSSTGYLETKLTDNLAIAYHAVIENAIGTNAADLIIGNAWNNTLSGGGGDDVLLGDGEVYLDGNAGYGLSVMDYPTGNTSVQASADSSGDDHLYGEAGDDHLNGGAGYDHLVGGDDNDTYFLSDGLDLIEETSGANAGDGDKIVYSDSGYIHAYWDIIEQKFVVSDGRYSALVSGQISTDANGIEIAESFVEYVKNISSGTLVAFNNIIQKNFSSFSTSSISFNNVYGLSTNDNIYDTASNERIYGYAGDDDINLNNGGGVDIVDGGGGSDNYYYELDRGVGSQVHFVESAGNSGTDTIRLNTFGVGTELARYYGTGDEHLNLHVSARSTTSGSIVGEAIIEGQLGGSAAYEVIERGYSNNWTALVIDASTNFYSYGSDGVDLINGLTAGGIVTTNNVRDTIYAAAGNDIVNAGAGNDFVFGGTGSDTVHGDDGEDNLYGEVGNDTLHGDAGADYIYGGDGNDQAWGGSENDFIYGDEGNDTLHGDSGNDRLEGGLGNDTLNGGEGNDTLISEEGDDTVNGGSGDDTITDTSGANALNGQDGNDTITGGSGIDQIDGGAGIDLIQGHGGNDDISGGADNDTIYGEAGNDSLDGDGGTDNIYGDDGNDTISGGGDGDTLYGNAGNDAVSGGLGNDFVWGGTGNDTLNGNENDDTIRGEDGEDTINGGDGNDYIVGGKDSDTTYGGLGNDTITESAYSGGSGDDTIYGEGGDDTITDSEGVNLIDGGDGNDNITGGGNLYGGLGNDVIGANAAGTHAYGGEGNDTITLYPYGLMYGYGGAGNDTLKNNYATQSILFGEDGDDKFEINGAFQNYNYISVQQINGGSGSDTFEMRMSSTYSNDGRLNIGDSQVRAWTYVSGVEKEYYIGQLDGVEHVAIYNSGISGYQNNVIDTKFKTSGSITSGFGNDIIYGYASNVSFDGSLGINTLNLASASMAVDVNLSSGLIQYGSTYSASVSNFTNLVGTGHSDDIFANSLDNFISSGAGVDYVYGGLGSDIIFGGNGNDVLLGDLGVVDSNSYDDEIYGGTGADAIFGEGGNDTLYGDGDSDAIRGGYGNDTIYGGSGNDNLRGEEGVNIIYGGQDIDTVDYAWFNISQFDGMSLGVTVNLLSGVAYDTENYMIGANIVTDALYEVENITTTKRADVLIGNSLSNILSAGDGNDYLSGGDGADTLYGGNGNDFMEGGAGNDFLSDTSTTSNDVYSFTSMSGTDTVTDSGGSNTFYFVQGLGDSHTIVSGAGTVTVTVTTGSGSYGAVVSGNLIGNSYLFGAPFLWTEPYAGDPNPVFGAPTQFMTAYTFAENHVTIENRTATSSGETLNGSDTFGGLTANDIIYGYGGNDTINGLLGSDTLYGGDGNDYAYGGDDGDTLFGEAGDDILSGEAGNDILWGGAGVDYLWGNTGNDTLYGEAGADALRGLEGNDTIYGGDDNDNIKGDDVDSLTSFSGAGNDTLYGGNGNDNISGGAGNDILYGDAGQDTLWGNAGSDTFVFDTSSNAMDYVMDFVSQAGGDILDISEVFNESYDVLSSLSSFVQLQALSAHTRVQVDRDGLGSAFGWENVAQLQGLTGLNLSTLQSNGALIVD